jgi:hypothetical protein
VQRAGEQGAGDGPQHLRQVMSAFLAQDSQVADGPLAARLGPLLDELLYRRLLAALERLHHREKVGGLFEGGRHQVNLRPNPCLGAEVATTVRPPEYGFCPFGERDGVQVFLCGGRA